MVSFGGREPPAVVCNNCCNFLDKARPRGLDTEYLVRSLAHENGCPLCRLILQLLPQDIALHATQESNGHAPQKCLLRLEKSGDWQVYFEGKLRGSLHPSELASPISPSQSHPFDMFEPLSELKQVLDADLVRRWMKDCETKHPDRGEQHDSKRHREAIDLIFVDVIDNRLVRASSRKKFFALSYVWGNVSMFLTTAANRFDLERVGGLLPHLDQIPSIIRDTMQLVKALGERYLWVDALCIEQDHAAQKHEQIARMDIVYGHAFLTIIAIGARDASYPLPGIRPDTRRCENPTEVIRGQPWTVQKPHFSIAFQDSAYERRGWTMQERLFSKRCLYLTEFAAYWNCCRSVVMSDNDHSSRYELCLALQTNGNFAHFLDIFGRPPLQALGVAWDAYKALVAEFTRRNLTYPTDTLNAFAGISAALQNQLGTHFTCGLPECFLDVALHWTPDTLHVPMVRNQHFSSWSWAGWLGRARINGGLHENRYALTYPVYTKNDLRLMIDDVSIYYHTPHRKMQFCSLAQHEAHVSAGQRGNEARRGWDILCFTAFSAGLSTFSLYVCGSAMGIYDREGAQCGVLFASPSSPIFANWSGSTCEIVLLSRSANVGKIVELMSHMTSTELDSPDAAWDRRAYPKTEKWNVCNIMLIMWNGDFAERLCLGCMNEDAWNATKLRKKRITLR